MARLLVVDDDHALVRALRIGLSARGYDVTTARNGEDALSETALSAPDVVLLDLGLPDMDGLEVCRRIRQWTDIPVIVLSALGTEDRKVAALDGGADDYVTKPFGMAELEARIRVALRHRQATGGEEQPAIIDLGSVRVDFGRREVSRDGRAVDLTAREFDLLGFLAANAGKVCTHRLILENVWGAGYGHEVHYLRVYANRLRRKLGDDEGRLLRTNPGVGYQLVGDADS